MAARQISVKHTLQGLMVQYEDFFEKSNWNILSFPADLTFGTYQKMMQKNMQAAGLAADAQLFLFIKPGGQTAGFAPTPDQNLGDLFDLFKTTDGKLIIDIAAQPMYG